ncbi:MAG: glycosyltransferase family 4 protein [Candidatus Magasanikbacteria bacterium]|nr:glycosyltransferase family 4 protein [Candidatus Magasanikbacteria bacterium]
MKICLISNLYPPYNRGGAEQVVKNTVEGLIERGHQVVVVTSCPWGKTQNENLNNKLKIYRFFPWNFFFYGNDYKYPTWLRFGWHILDVFNLHSYFVIKSILQKEKPDVVHTHNLKGLGFLIPLAIKKLKLFHVHTLHDVQLVEPSGIIITTKTKTPLYELFRHTYEIICRALFSSPQVIISPSKFLLEFYEHRGFFKQSRKLVIPNPVLSKHQPILTKPQDHPFTFLYLGQIEEHKGVLFLIEAFKKFLQIFAQAHLLVVGSGSKLEQARVLAAQTPQIIIKGRVEREDLPPIFASANLTVVPSLCYENSPTVIFESFSFGVPVLASSIEGVAELIKDGENGLTFSTGDEEALIQKLTQAVKNPEQIQAMRAAALNSIQGRGLDEYLDKLLKLCYNVSLS